MSRTMKRRTREPHPDASDGATVEVAAEEQARPGQFGLQVSAPPADLVTSDRLKGVRFDLAQPRGYYTEQVDTLVKLLTSSLAWHEEALYQRDQGIHVLQTDLDAATQQEATLRAQVEVFRVQGSVTVGEDGQILRKSQVTAAKDALAEAKGATAAVDQRLAASIEEVRSLREWADIVIPQTAQIAEVARVAQEQLEVAVQELAAGRERSSAMATHVASLESQVASLESQVASLESQVASLGSGALKQPVDTADIPNTPEIADTVHTPEIADTVDTVDTPDTDCASSADAFDPAPYEPNDKERELNLDDPELPVGVTLPRAKYDREYIPASPGDPLLVDRRSTLEVWAPELFPDQDVTPAPGRRAPGTPAQDDGWGDPLDVTVDDNPPPAPIQQGEATASDVSDGIARPQLRRRV
jgi:hypothetical protein